MYADLQLTFFKCRSPRFTINDDRWTMFNSISSRWWRRI